MPNYFGGDPEHMGRVSRLAPQTFAELCALLATTHRLGLTRAEFFGLQEKERQKIKRAPYLTPAEFKESPSQRVHEQALRCNLLILDIDRTDEAKRLLSQRWDDALQGLGYVVWHTSQSTDDKPRLRIVVSAQGLEPDRYVAAARTVAEMVGIADITSQVTFHAVQPAFVPTCFADDPEDYSPIIASCADGGAFSAADILDGGEGSYALVPASDDTVADLAYLRVPMDGVTLDDAKAALAVLDPDTTMQSWIEIAAGLKHQFGDAAYALWDEWSAKGKKYVDAEETRYRWNSLKAQPVDRAPVTIRSVFKQAQARGWENPTLAKRVMQESLTWFRSGKSAEELLDHGAKRIAKAAPVLGPLEKKTLIVALRDSLRRYDIQLPMPDLVREVRHIERETQKATGVLPWAKGLCFVTATNQFYRHTTDRRFSPEVLDLMYSVPPVGDEKPLRPRDYVVQIAGCPQVENLRYDPAMGDKRFFSVDEVPYVNTYRRGYTPADPTRAEEAGAMIEHHLSKLIREPQYQRILLSYLAYMVQQPGKKVSWAPLIQSGEGAGKSTLHEIMACVLGRRNTLKIAGTTIMTSNYTDWAVGHQLVTIEEVRIVGSNRHTIMDKLKPLVTDNVIGVDKKYEDHRSLPNVTNYLMFTNYQDALAIREDGRRYFVLSSPLQHGDDIKALHATGHYRNLYAMIRDNPGGLRAWFETYQLDVGFDPEGHAPATPYLPEFAKNAATPLAAAVHDAIHDSEHPLVQNDLLSLQCLRGLIDATHIRDYSDQGLASVLRELGWTKAKRCMVDGAMHQLWSKGTHQDVQKTATARVKNF
jgi:hypothetical protein